MTDTPFRIVALQPNEADNKLLCSIFNRAEFDLKSFAETREFIQYQRIQPVPRCFITDLDLPDSSGEQLIKKIRSDNRWQKVPIVVLANSVDKTALMELNKLKINGYIVKPYQPQKLLADTLKAMGLEMVTERRPVRRVKADRK
ncbi:MAG: response regulator [Kangiellaceae bacterium]|jgi:two-component system chemotaxis response regulator CheY|nr:response regulator [Kangiellaceae bacterium]